MRKRERLLNLLCLLWSSKRKFTREEIFRRMAPYRTYANPETARRTFERDKAALRQVGFDIQTDQPEDGPATYILAQPSDAVGAMELSDSERVALGFAVAMVRLGEAHSVDRTLIKLGVGLAESVTAINLGVLESGKVNDLLLAVQSRSPVFFDYKGRRRRGVEPLRIVNRRGNWYALAREDGVEKVFRVDRISNLKVSNREDMYDLPSLSEGPNILNAEPWEYGEDPSTETTIRFDADSAWYVRPRLPSSAQIQEEDDGSLTVLMGVTNRAAFFVWMLDFAPDGEVLSPDSMRREMVEWVRQSVGEAGL